MGSGIEDETGGVGATDSDDDQHRCSPKANFGVAMGRRARAIGALGAIGRPRLAVDEIKAVAEAGERDHHKHRLIAFERSQIADPRTADAGEEQGKGHHAAGCRTQCSHDAATESSAA